MDGILNIYKEKGYTSHDVVAKLRGILKQKKIGHTGTLDPQAEGVLPVCLGKATKLCDLLTEKEKAYETVMKLGILTDTEDMEGKILETRAVAVTKEEITEAVEGFIGSYEQIPPMYSALKVNGKKLYELAREGKVVERKPRCVNILNIKILDIDEKRHEVRMTVDCSKGTYIRTLCKDIGEKLGCGGCMKSLLRTKVSRFELNDSLKLSEVEQLFQKGELEKSILAIDQMFLDLSKLIVAEEFSKLIYNGNMFTREHLKNQEENIYSKQVRVYDYKETFIGIYRYDFNGRCYKPLKMFL